MRGEEGDVLGRACTHVVRKQSVNALTPQCESMSRMMDLRVLWEWIIIGGMQKGLTRKTLGVGRRLTGKVLGVRRN